MTEIQFKSEMQILKNKELEIRNEISALKQKWVDACPFKYGDKIRIKQTARNWNTEKEQTTIIEGFVGNVSFRRYSDINPEYDYDLRKIKKDGTISGQSLGIYLSYSDTIEKI